MSSAQPEAITLDDQENMPLMPEDRLTGLLLSWTEGAVFVVAITAGSGFLSLPKAIEQAGVYGMVLLLIFTILFWHTGEILSQCFQQATRRKGGTQGDRHARLHYTPYQAIAELSYSNATARRFSKYLVDLSINFTMVGSAIVYVILASESINSLEEEGPVQPCHLVIIIGAVLIFLLMFFQRPRHLWWVAVLIVLFSVIASLIMLINIGVDARDYKGRVSNTTPTMMTVFSSMGTILFAVNGHALFPNFQADMKNRNEFGKSLRLGFFSVFLIFTPTTLASYFVYGSQTPSNLIYIIKYPFFKSAISSCMAVHLILRTLLVLNPVLQRFDTMIPEGLHRWKKHILRLLIRTSLMIFVVITALLLPDFQIVLTLVGATTLVVLALVCPPIFYIRLSRGQHQPFLHDVHAQFEGGQMSLWKRLWNYCIVMAGIVLMVLATWAAIQNILDNADREDKRVTCFYNMSLLFNN